jgi:hypothetical protein
LTGSLELPRKIESCQALQRDQDLDRLACDEMLAS